MAKANFSYDRLAKHYDFLSRLVFGTSQIRAQTEQLIYIENCKRILIVGGGTGWILKHIDSVTAPLQITFLDTSAKMLGLAKTVKTHHLVEFVHDDIAHYHTNVVFDAVLTPFLFDNFNDLKAKAVFQRIAELLMPSGLWLYTDFKLAGKWWQISLLKTMYWFFRVLKVVKTSGLPNMEHNFNTQSFELMHQKSYYGGFIEASVYRKIG